MDNILLKIQKVAVIGTFSGKDRAGDIITHMMKYGFKGHIFPICTMQDEIFSIRAYPSVQEVPDQIDLAVITVPDTEVFAALESCLKKIIPLVIVISPDTNGDISRKIKEMIQGTSTRVIGPSSGGIIIPQISLNASIFNVFPMEGNISFVSDSIEFTDVFLDWAEEHTLGIKHLISLGECADLQECDFLENVGNGVIACSLRQIRNGKRLMRIGYAKNKERPVVVFRYGKKHIQSKDDIISNALAQTGYIEADTLEHLFQVTQTLAWLPIPKSNTIAIAFYSKDAVLLAYDVIHKYGLISAEDNEDGTYEDINALLQVSERKLKGAAVSSLMLITTPRILQLDNVARHISDLKRFQKPVVVALVGGSGVEKAIRQLSCEKVPAFHYTDSAIGALASISQYGDYIRQDTLVPLIEENSVYYAKNHLAIYGYYAQAQRQKSKRFSRVIVEDMCHRYSIQLPHMFSCNSIEEAESIASTVKFPCIAKLSSPDLLYEAFTDDVISNIRTKKQLHEAYYTLEGIIETHHLRQAYIALQSQPETPIIATIACYRDKEFGSILTIQTNTHTSLQKIIPFSGKAIEEVIEEMVVETDMHIKYKKTLKHIPQSIQAFMIDYSFISTIHMEITSHEGLCITSCEIGI